MRATTISCCTFCCTAAQRCIVLLLLWKTTRPTQADYMLRIIFSTVTVRYSNIPFLFHVFTPHALQHQHSKLCRTNQLSTSTQTHASSSRDSGARSESKPVLQPRRLVPRARSRAVKCGQRQRQPQPPGAGGEPVTRRGCRPWPGTSGARLSREWAALCPWDETHAMTTRILLQVGPRCMRCTSPKGTLTLGMLQNYWWENEIINCRSCLHHFGISLPLSKK